MVMVEGQLFEKELAVRALEINKQFREIDPEGKLAVCFEHLAEGRALSLLLRYESQLNRTHDRAFKQLQALQANRPEPVPNEPKPFLVPPPNEPTEALGSVPEVPESVPEAPETTDISGHNPENPRFPAPEEAN